MTEVHSDCAVCTVSGSLERVPFIPLMFNNSEPKEPQVGSLVIQHIEEAKAEIKVEKEKYKKEEYKE